MSEFSADEVRVLKQIASGLLGGGASGGGGGAAADDHILDAEWCQKLVVKKLPAKWKGSQCIGARWADLSSEDCMLFASLHQWKSDKQLKEKPEECNDKGKPWWEVERFNAEIFRGFAKRNKGKKMTARPAEKAPTYPKEPEYSAPEYETDPGDDGSDLPF